MPFLSGSSPLLQFGTCLANKHCQGTMLLSNPTGTSARWSVVHVPGGGASRKISQIRVKGLLRAKCLVCARTYVMKLVGMHRISLPD